MRLGARPKSSRPKDAAHMRMIEGGGPVTRRPGPADRTPRAVKMAASACQEASALHAASKEPPSGRSLAQANPLPQAALPHWLPALPATTAVPRTDLHAQLRRSSSILQNLGQVYPLSASGNSRRKCRARSAQPCSKAPCCPLSSSTPSASPLPPRLSPPSRPPRAAPTGPRAPASGTSARAGGLGGVVAGRATPAR